MDPNLNNKIKKHLTEIEQLAEEILVDKQELIAINRRQNQTREAARAVTNGIKSSGPSTKTWLAMGNMFIKLPQGAAKELLERDQTNLNDEVNRIRQGLKPKLNKLRDVEHKEEILGFNLQPLSREEVSSVHQVLSGTS